MRLGVDTVSMRTHLAKELRSASETCTAPECSRASMQRTQRRRRHHPATSGVVVQGCGRKASRHVWKSTSLWRNELFIQSSNEGHGCVATCAMWRVNIKRCPCARCASNCKTLLRNIVWQDLFSGEQGGRHVSSAIVRFYLQRVDIPKQPQPEEKTKASESRRA